MLWNSRTASTCRHKTLSCTEEEGGEISRICAPGERQPYQTKALSNDQISNMAITRKDPILRTSFTETHELSDYRESIPDCQLVPNDRQSAGCRPSAAHDPRERGAGE
jgi:hypothetical protein